MTDKKRDEQKPGPDAEKKEARTCTICGQSEDKKSPAGDCPPTDEFGIHNFTAEGDEKKADRPPSKQPQTPPSREELDQILKQRQEQPPDRPLGS